MNTLRNKIVNLFRKPTPEPQPEIKPVLRESSELRLNEWRKSESLVEAARALANNASFKLIKNVLQNEHPRHNVLAFGVNPNDRIVHQCRIEGYEMCLNNLDAFAKPLKTPDELKPSYSEPAEERKKR